MLELVKNTKTLSSMTIFYEFLYYIATGTLGVLYRLTGTRVNSHRYVYVVSKD